jgi:hypothetical protein
MEFVGRLLFEFVFEIIIYGGLRKLGFLKDKPDRNAGRETRPQRRRKGRRK